ncbi:unnamed protein product [Hydatigera taeniaeformis]|uniref:Uncharacterized protein n=1 Tax=Hydatigena taeniaeformis TaxID=6205 RepID=A0A0R3X1C2_HYDTA|nr:unnamed protein product [Hydatigera taeniaeformis]
MMVLFGSLAMLDDFCPRLSFTVIPTSANSPEDGEGPAVSSKKLNHQSRPSSLILARDGILTGSRSIGSEAINRGNERVNVQSPVLLENEPVELYTSSNGQNFQPPMIETSFGHDGDNLNVVQLSSATDEAVDRKHNCPRFLVLPDRSMSPLRMHDESTSVSQVMISSNSNKAARDEKGGKGTISENQALSLMSVERGISTLEESTTEFQNGDRDLQTTTTMSFSYSYISRTRRRRKVIRRTTELFHMGSNGDLERHFDNGVNSIDKDEYQTEPDLRTMQGGFEQLPVDKRVHRSVSVLPNPQLRSALGSEVTGLPGQRQQCHLPRKASLVARESINLSLQALYTPTKFGSDRAFYFSLDAENTSQVWHEDRFLEARDKAVDI